MKRILLIFYCRQKKAAHVSYAMSRVLSEFGGALFHPLPECLRVIARAAKPGGERDLDNGQIGGLQEFDTLIQTVLREIRIGRQSEEPVEKLVAFALSHRTCPGDIRERDFFRIIFLDETDHILDNAEVAVRALP